MGQGLLCHRADGTTSRKLRFGFGSSPAAGDNPEDAEASSTLISRAFIPPCIRGRQQRWTSPTTEDCLSRTRHLHQQAGTLDAHLLMRRAIVVPNPFDFAQSTRFRRKTRAFRALINPPYRGRWSRFVPRQRATAAISALYSRVKTSARV